MLKKKKIILATGCSFTDKTFKSRAEHLPDEKRGGWPMWPELLKRKIEKATNEKYELINLARSGGSNDWVLNTFLDAMSQYGDRIKIVLVGGTQWQRTQVIATDINSNPQVAMKLRHKNLEGKTIDGKADPYLPQNAWQKWHNESVVQMWSKYSNGYGMKNTIYHNLRIMWTLLNICNNNKTKFIWNQLINPFPPIVYWRELLEKAQAIPAEDMNIQDHVFKDPFISNTVLESSFAKQLVKHKKQFYGFSWSHGKPWTEFNFDDSPLLVLPPTMINGKKELDGHPNKAGQESIVEEMWEVYGNYLVKN